jgi:hypothetical protein
MEYRESSHCYVDRQGGTVTHYSAWYEISPHGDHTIRCFLVPGSLQETIVPCCVDTCVSLDGAGQSQNST